jgi:hypothetical protein
MAPRENDPVEAEVHGEPVIVTLDEVVLDAKLLLPPYAAVSVTVPEQVKVLAGIVKVAIPALRVCVAM